MRTSWTIAAAVLGFFAAGMPASAALLGLVPENPRIAVNNHGTTDYDAGTDVFEVIASPLVILQSGNPPRLITPTAMGELFRITIEVDDTGALVGGGILPDDLEVIGEVDLDGDGTIDASGVLLTGNILEFGFQDTGTSSDEFDFRFEVTGGSLAPLYAGLDLAFTLLSEGSDFEIPMPGFTASFGGEAKGTLGSVSADCVLRVNKTCEVVSAGGLECQSKVAATRLLYTGPDMFGVDVDFEGKSGASAFYMGVDLISGVTVLESPSQNDFTIDADASGEKDLGSKMTVLIDGFVQELIHTSCSVPYVAGLPAPLDGGTPGANKGDPSDNWSVESFRGDDGRTVDHPPATPPTNLCTLPAATGDKSKKSGKSKKSRKSKRSRKSKKSRKDPQNEVEFTYVVENLGLEDLFDITVEDDVYGTIPGSPIAMLAPGDIVTLAITEEVTQTTTNTVTVEGMTANEICEDTSFATVRVPVSCADGKPQTLVFEYTGEDCSASNNPQEGKADCFGDPMGADPVEIVGDPGDVSIDPPGEVLAVGDLVIVDAVGGRFGAQTDLEVRQGDVTLQTLSFHTSCSKLLAEGNQFGSLLLREFIPR